MAAKLGSTDVSFRLGATTPAAVYLGSEQVWSAVTVPGAPTITLAYWDSDVFAAEIATEPDDGGSPITGYNLYFDGTLAASGVQLSGLFLYINPELTDRVGQSFQVAAANSIGEGTKSNAFTVTPL